MTSKPPPIGTTATDQLVAFAADVDLDDIPSDVATYARYLVFDTLTCITASHGRPGADVCNAVLRSLGGVEQSTVFPSGWKTSAPIAAFANANAAKVMDFDDNLLYHSHIANTVVPVAIACGQARNRSIRDILHAIVVGYEIAARVSLSMPLLELGENGTLSFPNPNTHSYNTVGAVVTASILLDLPAEALQNAFGISAVSAPLPAQARSTSADSWPTFKYGSYGFQAWTACLSALLAEGGMTGDRAVLDGPDGFWRMCGATGFDPDGMTKGLGDSWYITETSFKLEPAGTWMRSALRAVRLAKGSRQLRPTDIDHIDLRTRTLVAGVFAKTDQKSYMDTQVSYAYLIAVEACGVPPEEWSDPGVFGDREIRRVANEVRVSLLPEAVEELRRDLAVHPHRARGVLAEITIVLTDGSILDGSSKYGDGDPFSRETRISEAKLIAKFGRFAGTHLRPGAEHAALGALSDGGSLDALVDAFTVGSA